MAYLESVNCGTTVDVPWGSLKRSAIDKRPVDGAVEVTELGLVDDDIADLVHHGGPDQAVYAYAREDLDAWADEFEEPLTPGQFGENLTTVGLDIQNARLGDRWKIGSTVLEVCAVRIPCSVFQGHIDQPQWVKRFTARGVPGAYLRVVEPGQLAAGDSIDIVEQRDHDVTVGLAFRALTTERELLPKLAVEPRAATKIRDKVENFSHKASG